MDHMHPPELATTGTCKAHCTVQKKWPHIHEAKVCLLQVLAPRLMKTLFLFLFFFLFLVAHLATTSGIQLHIHPANHIRHCSRTTTSDFPQEVSRPEKVTFSKQPASVRLSCSIRTNASLRRTSTQASTARGQSCTPVASNVTATPWSDEAHASSRSSPTYAQLGSTFGPNVLLCFSNYDVSKKARLKHCIAYLFSYP